MGSNLNPTETAMPTKCTVVDGYIMPCHYLEKALDERGIMLRTMCDLKTGKEKGTMLFCSTGGYRKRQMGMIFCPFCGEGLHEGTGGARAALGNKEAGK